jgi:hypothetical protein
VANAPAQDEEVPHRMVEGTLRHKEGNPSGIRETAGDEK